MSRAFSLQQVEALVVRFKHTLLRLRRLTADKNTEHIIHAYDNNDNIFNPSISLFFCSQVQTSKHKSAFTGRVHGRREETLC